MRVGFLHLDPSSGGIRRYSTMLAAAMHELPDVEVLERTATGETPVPARVLLREIVALRRADVTVLQYSRHHTWAPGRARLAQVVLVHLFLRRRTLVVLHDVSPSSVGPIESWSLRLHLLLAQAVVVHGAHERARLPRRPKGRRATIPHFMETRALPPRDEARRAFRLGASEPVLGVLGWVYPAKNHGAAVRALALLEPTARLWVMGAVGPGSEAYVDQLSHLAERLGVRDRVEVTGYLSEAELNVRLAAMDVALCPYLDAAASGSLATLLAAGKPVVASDLPAFREQARYAGGLLRLVSDTKPDHLSAAVRSALEARPTALGRAAVPDEVSIAAVARLYLELASGSRPAREAQ
jgi:glycosyltransferase involved in cell wall biosynthesis